MVSKKNNNNQTNLIKPLPFQGIFLSVLIIFNILGIFNFSYYSNILDVKPLFFLLFISVSGFIIGTLLMRNLNLKISPIKGSMKPLRFTFYFYITVLLSFVMIIMTHVMSGGIVIALVNKRFTISPLVTLIIYSGILSSLLYFSKLLIDGKPLKLFFVLLFMQTILVLSLGYRAPMVVLLGGSSIIFFIIETKHKRKMKKLITFKNILYFAIGMIIISLIAEYRVSLKYNTRKFFKNINHDYFDKHRFISPFRSTLSVFRYDQEVVEKLIKATENNHLNGELITANFKTIMPGMQLGARNMIGELVNARKMADGRPWSITPTLQGALFVDGGRIAVFIGFFVLGLFLEYLKKLIIARKEPFSITLYALFFIFTIMLIHIGYYDVIFFLLLFILLVFQILIMRVKRIPLK